MTNMDKALDIVLREVGVHEIPGPKENKRILEYHAATKLKSKSETVSWCAAFASWVLQEAGLPSLHTAWARDYLKYGNALKAPAPGCLIVFERNAPGGDSHVTFFHHAYHGLYFCAGGNQHDSVNITGFGTAKVLGIRGF
jgi:uncharacterized protein (TIGR02594 family)